MKNKFLYYEVYRELKLLFTEIILLLFTITEVILVEESNENGHLTSAQSPHDYVRLNSVKGTSVKRENNALKIRTCFSFKGNNYELILLQSKILLTYILGNIISSEIMITFKFSSISSNYHIQLLDF